MSAPISIGATVVIQERGKVLLTLREDYEVWCLPGGHSNPGEGLRATAVREAKEEVGLDIEPDGLVGVYSWLSSYATLHLAIFTAHVTGGMLKAQAAEVLDIRYFDPANLPSDMFWWHRRPIQDALAGKSGVTGAFVVDVPELVATRRDLYALRDRSGLTRPEFYRYFFESGDNQYCEA